MEFDSREFSVDVSYTPETRFYDKIMEGLKEALAYQQEKLKVRTNMVEMSKDNPV